MQMQDWIIVALVLFAVGHSTWGLYVTTTAPRLYTGDKVFVRADSTRVERGTIAKRVFGTTAGYIVVMDDAEGTLRYFTLRQGRRLLIER